MTPFSEPTKKVYFRVSQGKFVTGYESKGNLQIFGSQFKGILKGILDKPEETYQGETRDAGWEFTFDCNGETYVLTMSQKEWKCAPLFSSLSSLNCNDLKKEIELVAWRKKPTPEKKNPTSYIFVKKNNFREDVPQKYPKLMNNTQPEQGVVYMPSKEPLMNGANPVLVNGRYVWNSDKEVDFIRQNILPGIYQCLADAEFGNETAPEGIMNDSNEPDFMKEQGETKFPDFAANAQKIQQTFGATPVQPPIPPVEQLDDVPPGWNQPAQPQYSNNQ